MKQISRFLSGAQWFGLAVVVSACVDSQGVGPDVFGDAVEFSTDISVANLESIVGSAAARVDIELGEEGLVARVVEIKVGEAMTEPEEIRSRVASLSITDASSSLTLELGDLVVGFNGETALRNSEGHELSLDKFAGHINEALAADIPVSIKARRLPADAPQAPDDAEFFASELRLQNDGADRALELNIDRDNLALNDAPPPDGWITVLGLAIEIRESEGLTEVRHAREDLEHIRFEGQVTSVNLDRHEFALGDDAIVRLIDISKIKFEDGDRHRLPSLAAVAQALRAGKKVFSAGEGVVESERPLTIIAAHVVFEVESVVEEFSGLVESVNLEAHTATLTNGVIVRIGDRTKIRHEEGSLFTLGSLAAVAEALRAGDAVFAAGYGEVESAADGTPMILALHVVFEVDIPVEEFEAVVESVNLDAGTFTLSGGLVVKITDHTRISADGDLKTLGGVAEAKEAGQTVIAVGKGRVVVENDASLLKASHVLFRIAATG